MAQSSTLHAQPRVGSSIAVRRAGAIPSVLYGHGVSAVSIQVDAKVFQHVLHKAGLTSLLSLTTEGKEYPVLIREVQHHPVKDQVIHADFYVVRMDEKIRTAVPLTFIGEAPAAKDLLGVLVKNIDEVELEALPKDLPHALEVDISGLTDFEKVIHVADLKIPAGVTLLQDGQDVVALVQPPRSDAELEALTAEVKEDVEAVEGIKKEESVAEGETPEADAEKAEAKDAPKKE